MQSSLNSPFSFFSWTDDIKWQSKIIRTQEKGQQITCWFCALFTVSCISRDNTFWSFIFVGKLLQESVKVTYSYQVTLKSKNFGQGVIWVEYSTKKSY